MHQSHTSLSENAGHTDHTSFIKSERHQSHNSLTITDTHIFTGTKKQRWFGTNKHTGTILTGTQVTPPLLGLADKETIPLLEIISTEAIPLILELTGLQFIYFKKKSHLITKH